MSRSNLVAAAALVVAATIVFIQFRRASIPVSEVVTGPPPSTLASDIEAARSAARGPRIDFLSPAHVGTATGSDDRPLVANVAVTDLDADGLPDIVVADAAANRVTWLRQAPAGRFTERTLADVAGPAHVLAVDLDKDGDLDIAVASLGVLFPNNARIGAVIVLDNNGRQSFARRVLAEKIARVSDVRAGDLDGDGDLDIVSLVSQHWEEIYVFVNDGRGKFLPRRIFGASNEDFGSSWITIVDLDRDGDADVLYSNGDAFDYAPPKGRGWNGVQWLENTGGLAFTFHRIADFSGASSPQAADLDGDGDLDIAVVSAYNDWARPDAQSLAWFENDGQMRFTLRDLATTPTHLITLAIGDLNGDKRPDLVTGGMHMSWPFDRLSRVMVWTNNWNGSAKVPPAR